MCPIERKTVALQVRLQLHECQIVNLQCAGLFVVYMYVCMRSMPYGLQVTLNLESKASHTRKQHAQSGGDYKHKKPGHTFSASNPYGKKHSADQRQFARI